MMVTHVDSTLLHDSMYNQSIAARVCFTLFMKNNVTLSFLFIINNIVYIYKGQNIKH